MLLVSEGVVISPPLSSLTLYGGGISPPFWNTMEKGVDFHPGGDIHPFIHSDITTPSLTNNIILADTKCFVVDLK